MSPRDDRNHRKPSDVCAIVYMPEGADPSCSRHEVWRYWLRRLFGSRAKPGPASNSRHVRQQTSVAAIVLRRHMKGSTARQTPLLFWSLMTSLLLGDLAMWRTLHEKKFVSRRASGIGGITRLVFCNVLVPFARSFWARESMTAMNMARACSSAILACDLVLLHAVLQRCSF